MLHFLARCDKISRMKICRKCKNSFEEEDFTKGNDGRCLACYRAYQAEWYQKNKEKRKSQLASYDAKRIEGNRQFICEYLSRHPCVDCGEADIVVLEFDHQGDKALDISHCVTRWGRQRLEEEVAKCLIRCANCHRRKTASDFDYYRLSWRASEPTLEEGAAASATSDYSD